MHMRLSFKPPNQRALIRLLLITGFNHQYQSLIAPHAGRGDKKRTTMKRTAMLFAALLGFAMPALANTTTGEKEIVEVKRTVTTYNKIRVNGSFEVSLVYGETGQVTLLGEKGMVGLVTTKVENGMLLISAVQPMENQKLKITIPYTSLDEVLLIGDGSITAKKEIRNDNFRVGIDGNGSIDLAVSANNVNACVLGDGDIRIGGAADSFDCRVVGNGAIMANSLQADNVKAVVSGKGDIKTTSNKSIKAFIEGKGNIAFAGEPAKTDLKHTGQGSFVY